ncbi:MAG: peptidylprolyl isomerase [Bacteroidetes bacterium]|jgi:FKBP-type peptidyl-prolyl cis-trans isomerase|nr:peptidylprolyl isomerase [Bacteroidota bacterium]
MIRDRHIKRHITVHHLLLVISVLIIISCRSGHESKELNVLPGREEMAEMNKYLVQKDKERIENYIERRGLSMTESSSGLWSYIEDEGEGKSFSDNDRVVMEYNCFLIDGTPCYSSAELGPRQVVLGRTEMEPGLDQALRLLRPGGKGLFILPSFLAYGLKGDGKKIPARATLVYEIDIKNEK